MAEDILEQMRRNPQGDWTIKDVERVCAEHGVSCKAPTGGGSHYKISHPGMQHIQTIPFKRPIKPVYIRMLVRFLEVVRRFQ
jgi:hypothetical protein